MKIDKVAVTWGDDGKPSCSQAKTTAGRALYGASSPRQHRTDPLRTLAEDRVPNLPIARQIFHHICFVFAIFPTSTISAALASVRRELPLPSLAMASKMASVSKRKSVVPSTSKATSGGNKGGGCGGDGSGGEQSCSWKRCGPSTQPSAGSIRPKSMADGFDSSPLHVKRGYSVGVGAVGSSHGRYGGSIGPRSPPFGLQSSWDPPR